MEKSAILLATFILFFTASGNCLGEDARNGKLLFESPDLGGGTSGKSCLTCHEDGRDLSPETLTRKNYLVMGNPVGSLAGVINFCIEVALRGEAIAEDGTEMNDLIAYLTLLAGNDHGRPQ
jgi:hypothetical protein